jgi:protein arginine kinase activator
MKCQNCPKLSTFQITEIHGSNDFEEFHFCDECTQKYLQEVSSKKTTLPVDRESVIPTDKHCEACGLKFVEFRNSGRLGCPHDYEAFNTELVPLLDSIHGTTRHVGKIPRSRPAQIFRHQELNKLRKDLQKAVGSEAYEEAAKIRDRIRQLEEG